MPKITKRLVDSAEPRADNYLVWDEELKGFCLRVHTTGSKSYLLKYRARGTQKQITIGQHGPMTPDEARRKAIKLLAEIKNGGDPAPTRGTPTVASVCARYLEEHVAVHNRASTGREAKRLVENRVVPALGKMKIEAVTRQDIQRLHHGLKHTKYEANRMLALLSKMFNLAEAWGLRPDNTNPCRHVKKYMELKRERFFTDEEMMRLGEAVTVMENEFAIVRGVATAIRLLALTGCRMSEILGLEWAHVDLAAATFRLEDAKAGARTVTLNAAALALLAGLPRDSEWVVGGAKAGKPLSPGTLEHSFQRIRERAGIPNARLHDLRHTVGTYAAQTGANAFLVRDLLGHKTLAMTGRYVERATDPQRVVSNQIGDRISAAMSGQSAEIVRLSKKSVA